MVSASYEKAVTSMYALGHELAQTPSQKFDLAHMRVLLEALERPERRFPAVLIAGTNGKGSTAATLAAILAASGLCTGLYTSPHLVRINERIRVFNQKSSDSEIGDAEFADLHHSVELVATRLVEQGKLPWHPSFFEMLTAIAFLYFAQQKVDIAVLEVGMGGRLDATNVVEPLVSVIADIALDHQKFLGDTITEIAREKAGIIRRAGVVVTLPQQPQANDVIGNAILDAGAKGASAVPYVPPVSPGSPEYLQKNDSGKMISRYPLQVMGGEILVETPLVGRHQLRNVALAVSAAEQLASQGFPVTAESIERGIRETRWPGRFQVFHSFNSNEGLRQEFILDVAHNPAGAWTLRSTLSAYCKDDERPLTFIFGAMRDKAIGEMAEILFPLAERVIATQVDNPRAATPEEIQAAAGRVAVKIEHAENVAEALDIASKRAGKNSVTVITGSIYMVGEAMRVLGLKI
ncbi:MAG: bifunctional folylpolyglutamate synthase/dihydrofolate synthase [Acidobacteriota bacterium]|nr:bifunctional folylpolyglutamate synthase/dihydrofolate synthase [Acidobacteriota bacterium]